MKQKSHSGGKDTDLNIQSKSRKTKRPVDSQDCEERFAADTSEPLGKSAKTDLSAEDMTDPVFIQYGPPFLGEGTKIIVNQRAVAAKCAQQHRIKFDESKKVFMRYDAKLGLWVSLREVGVCRLLSDLLLQLGEEFDHLEAVFEGKTSLLKSLCEMLKIHRFECAENAIARRFHVANGVLDLDGDKAKLVAHTPEYPFTISSGIHFDAKAKCPRFLDEFLRESLSDEDIELVQKYCGSMLLGSNLAQAILLIRGTAGGGKSTLLSVIEKVESEINVAHLRTKHLNGRFETSAFLGKRVLVGKDVPGDTLNEKGARLLKSLVGGDLLQAEIKYNPDKQMLRGDFHVVIASNTNLRIALDGDAAAWHRRLLVVDFNREKPAKPISNFADILFAEEASGILNWLVEGAFKFKAEMQKHGRIQQSKTQRERVDALLHDSDSMMSFVEQRVVTDKKSDVSGEELLVDYHQTCNDQEWRAVSSQEFKRRMPDIICHRFLIHRRNDIMRDKRAVRGYKGLALR